MKAPYVIVATKTAAAIIDSRNNNVIKSYTGRTSQRRAREYLEGLRVGWHGRELVNQRSCPHCNSNDLHGPSHDFYGTACVNCGSTLMIDRSQKLERDTIAQIIVNSIYDGDESYNDIALTSADDIIAGLTNAVFD